MNESATTAIFLITGLITATGTSPNHPSLSKVRSQLEDEYEAAIFTAERIIQHYPATAYAEAARELIDLARERYVNRGFRLN